jgi:hypothetical protein
MSVINERVLPNPFKACDGADHTLDGVLAAIEAELADEAARLPPFLDADFLIRLEREISASPYQSRGRRIVATLKARLGIA